jgi:hypothetical protein
VSKLRLKNSALLLMCEVFTDQTCQVKIGHGWTLSLHDGGVRPTLIKDDNTELGPGNYCMKHSDEIHLVVFTDRIQ